MVFHCIYIPILLDYLSYHNNANETIESSIMIILLLVIMHSCTIMIFTVTIMIFVIVMLLTSDKPHYRTYSYYWNIFGYKARIFCKCRLRRYVMSDSGHKQKWPPKPKGRFNPEILHQQFHKWKR